MRMQQQQQHKPRGLTDPSFTSSLTLALSLSLALPMYFSFHAHDTRIFAIHSTDTFFLGQILCKICENPNNVKSSGLLLGVRWPFWRCVPVHGGSRGRGNDKKMIIFRGVCAEQMCDRTEPKLRFSGE